MRTIVVLLIAALVMTPALAHAQGSGGGPGAGEAALVVLAIGVVLLVYGVTWIVKQMAAKTPKPCNEPGAMTDAPCDRPTQETPSTVPGEPSVSHSSTVPAPAVGSDR